MGLGIGISGFIKSIVFVFHFDFSCTVCRDNTVENLTAVHKYGLRCSKLCTPLRGEQQATSIDG